MKRLGLMRLLFAAACPAALAASLACTRQEPGTRAPAPGTQQSALAINQSCPHDAAFTITRGTDTVHYASMPVAGPISNVPEYHDCQRLLRDTSSRFGPLVGIWASWQLVNARDSLRRLRAGEAYAAAELYSWDGAYEPLGIRQYFNCLYMRLDSGGRSGRWRAWMLPVDTNGAGCLASYVPDSQATELSVTPTTSTKARGPDDVPPVARWDWSESTHTQTIGIMCAPAWCTVGMAGLSLSASYDDVTMPALDTVPEVNRVKGVRGWYDEQRLDPATGPKPNASGVIATVFPHPALLHYNDASFRGALASGRRFLPTAFVIIRPGTRPGDDAVLAQYQTKFNFAVGVNRVALCAGDSAACVPRGETMNACVISAPDVAWTARVTSARNHDRYMCVKKCTTDLTTPEARSMTALFRSGPGTARFRWMASDVTLWTSCPRGCCQLMP